MGNVTGCYLYGTLSSVNCMAFKFANELGHARMTSPGCHDATRTSADWRLVQPTWQLRPSLNSLTILMSASPPCPLIIGSNLLTLFSYRKLAMFEYKDKPWRSLYMFYDTLSTLLVRLPFWFVISLPPFLRPRRTWSLLRCTIVRYLVRMVNTSKKYACSLLHCLML